MKENEVQPYDRSKKILENCELEFLTNEESAIFKMIDLYEELHDTNYHDLSNSIELWISENPKENILEYIRLKQYSNCTTIIEIVQNHNL